MNENRNNRLFATASKVEQLESEVRRLTAVASFWHWYESYARSRALAAPGASEEEATRLMPTWTEGKQPKQEVAP